MKAYLFVGGMADGKRIKIGDEFKSLSVRTIKPPAAQEWNLDPVDINARYCDLFYEVYRPMQIGGGGVWVTIFILESMLPEHAVAALIEKYPDPKQ